MSGANTQHVAFVPRLAQQRPLRLRQALLHVLVGRKQMTVRVHRHHDRAVPELALHDLGRQAEPAVLPQGLAPRNPLVPMMDAWRG